jgi:choline kinase
MMQAIIYAAGVGRRLQGTRGELPKILLEFGGKTLLEWHVVRLKAVGVRRLTVVSGYQKDQVAQALDVLGTRYDLELDQLVNEAFTEGSVLSFAVSLPLLETLSDPVLLMDGDVLYPAEMLARLTESKHGTALLVDRDYSTADDDPVLVPISEGRPFDFVKKWTGQAEQIGESVGFFKMAVEDLPELIHETRQRMTGANRESSYDEVLRVMAQRGRFGFEDVTGLPWTEIDFPQDVERAEQQVLPAIESLEKAE